MKKHFAFVATAILAFSVVAELPISSIASAQPPRDGEREGGRGDRGNRGGGNRGGGFGGGPGGGMTRGGDPAMALLRSPEVREHLKLESVQEEGLKKIEERIREEPRNSGARDFDFRNATQEERAEFFGKMQEEQKKQAEKHRELLEEVLGFDQLERLDQLILQRRGLIALGDTEIQDAIELSKKQRETLQQVRSEQEEKMRERMRSLMQSGDRNGMREKMEEIREEIEKDVMAVLTPEQKKKFEDMKGEPFDFGDMGRGGRGGEGGRGGDARGGRGGEGGRGGDARGGRGGEGGRGRRGGGEESDQ
ncbi:hypothetical protein FHS27_002766 [Rhodopirellula rubra]|uniref:Secreted protein n=1 Tax=Aporhodopirellula rubra TaxID=980271 RepID=A0A7W5DZC2_9BACT|nr:hypothetical protein [Aporhodopirellula rubra]MBB3206952.1 hypothetical protein [Aporhodopirellula rubra]